jgi:hypothetical protein
MRTAFFRVITQRLVVIPYRRFETTCRSYPQRSRLQKQAGNSNRVIGFLLNSWPLKMGPKCCPETSVGNYHYSLCNNPEKHSSHLLTGGNLKSHVAEFHLEWEILQKNVADRIKKHPYVPCIFLYRTVYKTVWKNMVHSGRPQMRTQYGAQKM